MPTDSPSSSEPRPPVLIADADTSNANDVERELHAAGVQNPILRFVDGDGLKTYLFKAAESDDPKPCVLFLDPRMPGADGFNPARWINGRKSLGDLKVVVFSTSNFPEEIESAGELGVHLFLKKHPDHTALSSIVDHLCGATPTHRPD